MPKARAKKSKFIVRKSKKTGKQIKLYGAPMAKVLASEKARRRRNGAKRAAAARRRNVQGYTSGGRFHPIRSSVDYIPSAVGESFRKVKRRNARPATKKRTGARRNRRSQTSRKPFDAIIGSTPAAQFASTLGLANGRIRRRNASDAFQVTIDGQPYRFNRETKILQWSTDAGWRKVHKLVDSGHLKIKRYGGGTYGHEEFIYAGKVNPVRRKRRNPLGAMLLGVNGRGAARRKSDRRRRNGEGGLFEEFHGRPADGYKVGLAPIGTPKDTEFLGKLECIEYRNGSKSEMSFGHGDHDQPDLVANRSGKHLYFVGDIPCWPEKANQFHGYVTRIEYHAIKDHIDGGIKTLYFHKVGEETGVLPELWTDAEGYLVLKGGEYYVTADGIIN